MSAIPQQIPNFPRGHWGEVHDTPEPGCPDCPAAPVLRLVVSSTPPGPVLALPAIVRLVLDGKAEEHDCVTAEGARKVAVALRSIWQHEPSYEGLEVIDAAGLRWLLRGDRLEFDEDSAWPEVGGCDCGRWDCFLCSAPPPEAA